LNVDHRLDSLVHNAALDSAGWTPLVEALLDMFRGEGGGLNVADPSSGQSIQSLDYGIPGQRHAQYYGELFRIDPRIPAMAAMPVGTAFSDSELLMPDAIDRHPFYAWQAEFGYRHTLFLKLLQDQRHLGAIAIIRRIEEGAPHQAELDLARRLAPAIAHAAQVSRRIAEMQSIQAGLDATINAGARAFGLLDRAGTLVHANPAFASVLARGDGLILRKGRLTTRLAPSAAALQKALVQAITGGTGCALHVARAYSARPYRLVIEPLRPSAAERSGFHWGLRGGALLFLDDPDSSDLGSRARALQQIHGLTPAEAEIAEAIAEGMTIEDCAERARIRPATVRTHLKHIFAKLEVSKQSALAVKVLRLPMRPASLDL
jgi:DNA-binding CsgD family transcriptional regulator